MRPDYQKKYEKIKKHTGKTNKQIFEMWIDQYMMAFAQEMRVDNYDE